MTSPFDEDASTASLESEHNDTIDVSKAPAVVLWTDDNGQLAFLSHDPSLHDHVTFDIHFDAESATAFFKITANIAYKGKRNKSNVFLFIHPEHIESLTVSDNVSDNDEIAPVKLGTSARCLHFTLSKSTSLIGPKGDWVPKNEAARTRLESLQTVAEKTSFRVAFPSRTVAVDRLAVLCEKASSSGCLKTTLDAADVSRLYGGNGGTIISSKDIEACEAGLAGELAEIGPKAATKVADENIGGVKPGVHQHQPPEGPPSYDELGDSPPPHQSSVRKRRRVDSDFAAESVHPEKVSLEDICRLGFREIGRRFDRIEEALSDLSVRLNRVEQLAMNYRPSGSSSSEQEDWHSENNLNGRINSVEERVTEVEQKLEVGLSDMARDVELQIHDVRHEFNDTISVRVEDEMGVAQSQLEDFVKDELRNTAFEVEEIVKEKLRDGLA